jgi:nucleotide-binding universal stress UspA family protein
MLKKILIPTDGSEASERAIKYVISTLNIYNVDIIVLNVIESDLFHSLPQYSVRKSLTNHLCEERNEIVRKFKEKIEDQIAAYNINVNIVPMVEKGRPDTVILKTAYKFGVDHIIMVKSSKRNLEKVLLGSTTEKVVHRAKVPVTVIA